MNKPTLVPASYSFNGQIHSDDVLGVMVSEFGLLYGLKSEKFRLLVGLSGVRVIWKSRSQRKIKVS
ncbi:hypothetical protein M0L20_29195 [Spirosoma sp. RP8]|uniref:Uncharacterized protein n=1 Tax=Spirosoma liriopis TaxID=2937440 RepID=A0ABT0HUU9_9BACT|nr:hypothetical protein [Spirosoma liriopis]MCK8495977.1 hypothetical protein [Spirosoma liriopis]